MSQRDFSTREAYGPERIDGLEVSYPPEIRDLLRPQLRQQRHQLESRAKRLVWADERAALARSAAEGRVGIRRPDGEERSTGGVVLEKDEGDGRGPVVGWVDTEYRATRTEVRRNSYLQERRTRIHGGTKFAAVTIGRAHKERQTNDDKCIFVPGHGLVWVTLQEVVSTGDEAVSGAFARAGLTDRTYAAAKRRLDRIEAALTWVEESMRDQGLNPEIAPYVTSGASRQNEAA